MKTTIRKVEYTNVEMTVDQAADLDMYFGSLQSGEADKVIMRVEKKESRRKRVWETIQDLKHALRQPE